MRIFLLALSLVPFFALAQDNYSDILAEGKTWNLCRIDNGKMHLEGIRGDTIVEGRTCKRYGYVNLSEAFRCLAPLYQDGHKLYGYDKSKKAFNLLFDFGLAESDTLSLYNNGSQVKIQVAKTGQVSARGHKLKSITFKVIEESGLKVDYPESHVWIEGIGGNNGPFTPLVHDWTGLSFSLHEVDCGGETLYDGLIFLGDDYEKRFLSYHPEWDYELLAEATETDGEGHLIDCRAWMSGTEIPASGMFEYHVVTTLEAAEENRLLLRETCGIVLAKRDSYLEYVRRGYSNISQIYEHPYDWSDDVVLYDFTLGLGDRYPCQGDVYVCDVSQMTTRDGVVRKVLFLSNGLEIVEGVGCLNSPYGPFAYQNTPSSEPLLSAGISAKEGEKPSAFLRSLRKYGEASAPIYVMGDENAGIHPNTLPSLSDGPIYDITGRRLTSPPACGIYFQNGRKFAVRKK